MRTKRNPPAGATEGPKSSATNANAKATSGVGTTTGHCATGERAKLAVLVAPRPNSVHWTQTAIQWATLARWAADPADKKECGNYVLGEFRHTRCAKCPDTCDELHRNKSAVVSRADLAARNQFIIRSEGRYEFQMSARRLWPWSI